MNRANDLEVLVEHHPCFNDRAHSMYGRIHLPVAPDCNIRCRYCVRSVNDYEDRPGVTGKVLTPSEAIARLEDILAESSAINVVAVAGPGEPLANSETFEVFDMARKTFPSLLRCVATNGLLLYDRADLLELLGVSTVTVTVNAVDPAIASRIYDHVTLDGRTYRGQEAAEILIDRQHRGMREVISKGMAVKINTVFIPGVNGDHLVEIARRYAGLGIYIMNITPLIPLGKFAGVRPPAPEELSRVRRACSVYIEQFTRCRQCRADACGIPGATGGTPGASCH